MKISEFITYLQALPQDSELAIAHTACTEVENSESEWILEEEDTISFLTNIGTKHIHIPHYYETEPEEGFNVVVLELGEYIRSGVKASDFKAVE